MTMQAFERGQVDHESGKPIAANPWKNPGYQEHWDWRRGWQFSEFNLQELLKRQSAR